jgi:hypothetical protein
LGARRILCLEQERGVGLGEVQSRVSGGVRRVVDVPGKLIVTLQDGHEAEVGDGRVGGALKIRWESQVHSEDFRGQAEVHGLSVDGCAEGVAMDEHDVRDGWEAARVEQDTQVRGEVVGYFAGREGEFVQGEEACREQAAAHRGAQAEL